MVRVCLEKTKLLTLLGAQQHKRVRGAGSSSYRVLLFVLRKLYMVFTLQVVGSVAWQRSNIYRFPLFKDN